MDGFLTKPFLRSHIVHLLRRYVPTALPPPFPTCTSEPSTPRISSSSASPNSTVRRLPSSSTQKALPTTVFDRAHFMTELFERLSLPKPHEKAAIERAMEEHRTHTINRQHNEQRRLLLNREQPRLVPTFTKVGYGMSRVPDDLWNKVIAFWKTGKDKAVSEAWDKGNSYVNHWEIQPTMAYLPQWLKDETFRVMKPLLEEWSGVELEPTACYGIRLYHRGSVLENHVDRIDTHAISAIINVAQIIDEPWALEIYNHSDVKNEVFIQPQDMLFYESASRIHGRPTPFKGDYFANYFVHFKPKLGWERFDI